MQPKTGKQLRLLIIVNRLFEWSQNFITRELTQLHEQGVDLYIGTRQVNRRDDLNDKERQLIRRAILLPENPFLPSSLTRHFLTMIRRPKAYFQAWVILFQLRHWPMSKFIRSLVCLFRAATISKTIISKEINLIHAHFLTAPGDTAVFISKLTGIPFGGTGHAMDIYTDNSGLENKIKRAAYITTCTAANEKYLKSLGLPEPYKIFKIYHGIEVPPEFPAMQNHPSFIFLSVGRLVVKKGFVFLIEACKLLTDSGLNFKCIIIGVGPLETELKYQVHGAGLDDVVLFAGFVPPNEMSGMYNQCDVLVVPSIIDEKGDRDGLPNVCLEAMSYGLPVIGSNVSGIPEAVIPGITGWLVPPGNSLLLSEAMKEALNSPSLQALKLASRKLVVDNFSLEKNINELKGIMETYV